MKRTITTILIICLIAGCAGRTPRPVNAMNVDDKTKSSDMVAKYAHLSSEHLKT